MKGAAARERLRNLNKAAAPNFEGLIMSVPIYRDGKPVNLQAAILDTMFWLRWLRGYLSDDHRRLSSSGWSEQRAQLRLAIRALEEFLPGDPQGGYPSGYSKLVPGAGDASDSCLEDDQNQTLTPAQRAKVNLIKEKLRAKQQAMTKGKGGIAARAAE